MDALRLSRRLYKPVLFNGVWRVRLTEVASDGTSAVLRGFGFRQDQRQRPALSDGRTQGLDTDATQATFRPQLSTKSSAPGAEA